MRRFQGYMLAVLAVILFWDCSSFVCHTQAADSENSGISGPRAAAQGMTVQETTVPESATQGIAAQESATQGTTAQDSATQGTATQDSTQEMQEKIENHLLEEYDFSEIDAYLNRMLPEEKLTFGALVEQLVSQETDGLGEKLLQWIEDKLSYEFRYNKSNFIRILLIAVLAALFTNFSDAFQNRQISETAFFVLYLLLLTLCLNSFRVSIDGVEESVKEVLGLMQVLCPAYFLAVTVSVGSSTSIAFYNMVLFVIYLVNLVILNFLLPAVQMYMMIQILNHLSAEEYLTQLGELVEKGIVWMHRILLGLVLGLNVVQGLIGPAIDRVKRSTLSGGAGAIPVVGDALGSVADVFFGTAVLIKNGIGLGAAILVCLACVYPLLQMGVLVLMYKLAAALVEPVSDKRIVGCIDSVSRGHELLLRTIYTTGVLFLVTLAVVAATTGNG